MLHRNGVDGKDHQIVQASLSDNRSTNVLRSFGKDLDDGTVFVAEGDRPAMVTIDRDRALMASDNAAVIFPIEIFVHSGTSPLEQKPNLAYLEFVAATFPRIPRLGVPAPGLFFLSGGRCTSHLHCSDPSCGRHTRGGRPRGEGAGGVFENADLILVIITLDDEIIRVSQSG